MIDMPVDLFRYERLSTRRMQILKKEVFSRLDPQYKTHDPWMFDSYGKVSQMLSGILSLESSGDCIYDTMAGIELLIHRLFGQSMQTKRDPFIDESLVAQYLLNRNAEGIVVLKIGEDKLPAIRGLDAAVREFDEVVNALNLDIILGCGRIYPVISNPHDNFYLLGLEMRGIVLQRINSQPEFREKMKLLHRFQNALPFRTVYGDPYLDVLSELVPNGEEFRPDAIHDFMKIFRNESQSVAKELGFMQHSLQNAFNFDGLQISYGNPRDNLSDSVPSCVNGLIGIIREASIVYEADPNIEIIGIVPYLCPSDLIPTAQKRLDQIVKAITIKVRDREANNETKLIVDGVIADDKLERMLGVDWRPYMAIGILKYAQDKGIARVIINAENSDSHESVNSFKYFIATEVLNLQEGTDFSYKIERRTGNPIFKLGSIHIRNQIDNFPYTHLLDKDPMPEAEVKRLARSGLYQGEAYLDAWHEWIVYVIRHRDKLGLEFKTRFPYVEQRNPTMNPVWNLGRGPVVGMELDVPSVLPRLQRRYLPNVAE